MGSFQQVSIGVICLVAAFIFGSYVNNHPVEDRAGAISQLDQDGPGNVHSHLDPNDLELIGKRPAGIATMRSPLKPRFSLPQTDRDSQSTNEQGQPLPPPSQLATNDGQAGSIPRLRNGSPNRNGMLRAPRLVQPEEVQLNLQAVDFSAVAADFSQPADSPTKAQQPTSDRHVLGEPSPDTNSPLSDLPSQGTSLKQLAKNLGTTNPDLSTSPLALRPAPAITPGPSQQNWGAEPQFSEQDFDARLKHTASSVLENPATVEPHPTTARQPDASAAIASKLTRLPEPDPATGTPPSGRWNQPQPVRVANKPETNLPEVDANQWNRSNVQTTMQPNPDITPLQPSNRVRTKLPFGLNDQAKDRLVRITARAKSKMGLETTEFVDHVVQPGESLQAISTRYFGAPDYYLDIYLANRNKLRNPAVVPTGVTIRVPVYK